METPQLIIRLPSVDCCDKKKKKPVTGNRKCIFFPDVACESPTTKLEICKRCMLCRINSVVSSVSTIYNSVTASFRRHLLKEIYNKIIWLSKPDKSRKD